MKTTFISSDCAAPLVSLIDFFDPGFDVMDRQLISSAGSPAHQFSRIASSSFLL